MILEKVLWGCWIVIRNKTLVWVGQSGRGKWEKDPEEDTGLR